MLQDNSNFQPFRRLYTDSNNKCSSSPSTQESHSPRDHFYSNIFQPSIKKDKQKSQLCKKFIQFGECPYRQKCKFAHGKHQLRKNSQVNFKYKTKQCDVFINEGCCMYGQRCNFIHQQSKENRRIQDCIMNMIKKEGKKQSHLLRLLKQ